MTDDVQMTRRLTLLLSSVALLVACAKEPPPRSVTEFVDNPMLLEAAVVRCAQDRSKSKYDAECVNARLAVGRIQAKEEANAKAALEARSERKMNAVRRNAAAAAEARRRAEAERARNEEAEYLAQFGVLPPDDSTTAEELVEGNLPVAVVPEAETADSVAVDPEARPPNNTGNAPVAELPSPDLDSVREELRRRNEEGGD